MPLLLSALLEAGFALFSDRYPRRRVIGMGLAVLSASLAACGVAESPAPLALGLGLAGTASGVACAAAQAELVLGSPGSTDRIMTRWVLFGGIGDVLTPLLMASILAVGGTYSSALLGAAVLIALQAAFVLGRSGDAQRAVPLDHAAAAGGGSSELIGAAAPGLADTETEAPSMLAALRAGAHNPWLWAWLLGAGMCTLLDEILVALAALLAQNSFGASPATAAAGVAAFPIGLVLGAWLTERLLARFSSGRVLLASALGCSLSIALVVLASTTLWMAAALALLGCSTAPQFALLQARAYAALPGRPGVVNALGHAFVALDILGPLALGLIADAWGLGAAVACLTLQPFTVVCLLALEARERRARS